MNARWLLLVGACALTVGPAAATPAPSPSPVPDGLDLQVERLERSEQADAAGAETSAMLFDSQAADALATADRARGADRRARTRALFVSPAPDLAAPVPTTGLFADLPPASTSPAPGPGSEETARGTWTAWGSLAAAAAGGGGSLALARRVGGDRG